MIPAPKAVTLATLSSASSQEVFDWVAYNLILQGRKSTSAGGTCMYRGVGGRKCAAGFLIADLEYSPNLEGSSWCSLVSGGRVPTFHYELIDGLQRIHDPFPPNMWIYELLRCADSFGLAFKYLDLPLGGRSDATS